jgi:hypothetical protein
MVMIEGRRMSQGSMLTYVGLALLLSLGSGCSRNVKMAIPNTAPGPRYTCGPVDSGGKSTCKPAATDVPADLNKPRTAFVIMPEQCDGRINQIVVLDAGSSDFVVDVTCAPPEKGIQPMD